MEGSKADNATPEKDGGILYGLHTCRFRKEDYSVFFHGFELILSQIFTDPFTAFERGAVKRIKTLQKNMEVYSSDPTLTGCEKRINISFSFVTSSEQSVI